MTGAAEGQGPAQSVDDVIITSELSTRPSRVPDYAAENRALTHLAQEMAVNPAGVMDKCAILAMTLCHAHSVGLSLLEPGGSHGMFRWRAAAGPLATKTDDVVPFDASPCGTVVTRNTTILFRHPERHFQALQDIHPRVHECLLTPWHNDGQAVGTLWAVLHSDDTRFDAEDARMLESLARFASAAHQVVTALSDARAKGEELRESEARLRLLVENACDYAIFTTDPHDRIESWWPGAQAVFGWTADEAVGKSASILFTPEDRARHEDRHEIETARANGLAPDRRQHVRKDGTRVSIDGMVSPLRAGNGALRGFLKIGQDVTARERIEESLRESEARFRHMADSAPALIWMTDDQGTVVFANMHHDHLFGVAAAEMLGEAWTRFVHADDVEAYRAAFAAAFQARQPFRAEVRVHGKDGRIVWLRSEGVPRLDDAGRFLGYTGCSVDITEARMAAEELEQRVEERTAALMAAEETLRQAQKMEAVGQLTGGIAHDFNNMLQGIIGGFDMARRRISEQRAEDALRYLTTGRHAAERAAGLTRRLLAFARQQRLEPAIVDVNTLVANLTDLIRRTVGPSIAVVPNLADQPGTVLCDPNELESALLNLCINARDAMPDGGRLLISTGQATPPAPPLADEETAGGPFVLIQVADTGTGMPPNVVARVFEPFFTTKPQGQGTGLGLSQVYGFVRQSGGVVRIESAPAQGTVVRLFLPARNAAPSEQAPRATAEPQVQPGGGTVLLVDDEAAARRPAADRIRELGYRVLEAADGRSALALLEAGHRIDMLVADVGLPGGMNGRQLAEAVRTRAPDVPVLFITGYTTVALPPWAAVIDKPFDPDTLALQVQRRLRAASA